MAVVLNKNLGTVDRLVRFWVATALFVISFFWLGGAWAVVAYVLAAVAALTATVGSCPLYVPFGLSTYRSGSKTGPAVVLVMIVLIVATATVGSYSSAFFTRKIFLEDFGRMNQPYKQVLFYTGQGNRDEAVVNYESWATEFGRFRGKYSSYRPYSLRGDGMFAADMDRVADIVEAVGPGVRAGDLAAVHLDLEGVRTTFQELLKRDGFSMLAVYLVDFHDSMENVLDAASAKDAAAVIAAYPDADSRLKIVEAEAGDAEIVAIRSALETVVTAARDGKAESLPDLGSKLKGAYVKVYLERG